MQQKMEPIKLLHSLVSIVAGVEGFEPSQAVLESVAPVTRHENLTVVRKTSFLIHYSITVLPS